VHALTTSHVLAYEGRGANAYRFAMDLGRPLNPLAVNVLAASRFDYFSPDQSLRKVTLLSEETRLSRSTWRETGRNCVVKP